VPRKYVHKTKTRLTDAHKAKLRAARLHGPEIASRHAVVRDLFMRARRLQLSDNEIAKRLGYSVKVVHSARRGSHEPRFVFVTDLAQLVGVTLMVALP
jgi:ribosome-binding protein aMBF1 (putative translation factor)